MKTQFSRKRNSLIGNSWIGPASLSVVGIALLFLILRTVAPGAIAALSTPFWKTGSALSANVHTAGTFFGNAAHLAKERDRLLAENATLRTEQIGLQAKVQDLTKLVGSRTEFADEILATVLVRPPVSPYDTFVLDQGSNAGVAPSMRVLGPSGVPLGTVESVTKNSSRVLLYSAPGRETASWVGEERLALILVGRGSGAFTATAAREAGVIEGDFVYIGGASFAPIGVVVSVANDPSSPRSEIGIRPYLNPFSTTWVTIQP
ncbi:rod shape-determining protein MreC [Patescibacteria group bacterium]|nr:rod shape-determining protein MreC [Patescibacteria group bacterium]